MDHSLLKYDLHVFRMNYRKPIKWSGHSETGIDVVLLTLHSTSGATGIAETPVRLKWNSNTVRTFIAALDDVVLPAISGVDLSNAGDVSAALAAVREHPLAKSLVDVACWDLRACLASQPIWRALGVKNTIVPVSFTLTKDEPKVMASEAAKAVESFGMQAFKVKTGQGADKDAAVLREIRKAVGDQVQLFADSNGRTKPEDVPEMSKMLAEHDVAYFEDPCAMLPNKDFQKLSERCALPILVDNGCRSLRDARLFMDAGAAALSAKVMKTGISESLSIGGMAAIRGVKVGVGIGACSDLGALAALSLGNALPESTRRIPCEETFFLTAGSILKEPLQLRNGCVELPQAPTRELIDWKKVESLKARA